MKSLEEAERQFRLQYLLSAVRENNGCISRAAAMIGIHRNTASRIMWEAGYDLHRLRQEAKLAA
jgi:DNA-binding NtrC family response regulator